MLSPCDIVIPSVKGAQEVAPGVSHLSCQDRLFKGIVPFRFEDLLDSPANGNRIVRVLDKDATIGDCFGSAARVRTYHRKPGAMCLIVDESQSLDVGGVVTVRAHDKSAALE